MTAKTLQNLVPIEFRIPSTKVDKYLDNSRLVSIFSSINFFPFSIKSVDFIDCYRMLSIIDFIDCKCQAVTHSSLARLPRFSGAPTRARRAWDRAPYSWNMVKLFSFGCHVTDRGYVRGVGETIKRKGRVSWQIHIFYIGHSQYGQLKAVKTG